MTPFSSLRLTRASTNRSRIWTMTPRFLTTMGAIGPRLAGGEIFSKLKAGMVYHLVIELRHSSKSPGRLPNDLPLQAVRSCLAQVSKSKHNLCQIKENSAALPGPPLEPKM